MPDTGTRNLIAVIAGVAILVAVIGIWLRDRVAQKRLSAGAARLVAEKLGGTLTRLGAEWRVVATREGHPVTITFGGTFLVNTDIDNRRDFVPTMNIEVPCASTADLFVHGNWPTGKNYLRHLGARLRGTKLSTGAPAFDAQFLVEGSSPVAAAIIDEGIQKSLLASKDALYGRSWGLQLREGSADFEEVFSEDGGSRLTDAQVAADALARVALVLALVTNAEQRTPSGAPSAPAGQRGLDKP